MVVGDRKNEQGSQNIYLVSTNVGSLLGPFTGNEVTSTDHLRGGPVLFKECSFLCLSPSWASICKDRQDLGRCLSRLNRSS